MHAGRHVCEALSADSAAGSADPGGGVRGERFENVATGVHAQNQRLIAYSGERLGRPCAHATGRPDASRRLGRPGNFQQYT